MFHLCDATGAVEETNVILGFSLSSFLAPALRFCTNVLYKNSLYAINKGVCYGSMYSDVDIRPGY